MLNIKFLFVENTDMYIFLNLRIGKDLKDKTINWLVIVIIDSVNIKNFCSSKAALKKVKDRL